VRLTLADALQRAAVRRPGGEAVRIDDEAPVTYAELWDLAKRVAAAIDAAQLVPRRVAILLPNSVEWVAALYGAALARAPAVLLNTRLTLGELRYQIEQSDARLLIATELPRVDRDELLRELGELPAPPQVVWVGSGAPPSAPPGTEAWEDWLQPAGNPPQHPAPDDDAVVIYTSGTTALPKGVVLRHASVVRNAWYSGWCLGLRAGDRVFAAGPFCHSGGLTLHVVVSALFGATCVSLSRFDPDRALDAVEGQRCAVMNGIETLFLRLLDTPRFSAARLASVRTGWTTGSPAIVRQIATEVGVPGVFGVYGISEASPNVTISHHEDTPEHRLDTVGHPQPWTRVRIVDPASGHEQPAGEIGELLVRGYQLMRGYYRKPEETAEALAGGWLHTGDLARRRPDGYLEFAGRQKDIVRVGGENVSCLEVEDALYALGGVALAAVLPVPDPVYGEVPVAIVQPTGAAPRDADELLGRLRERLASYKVPRRVVYVEGMPLTQSGKVQKRELREQVAVELAP
jgi:acyl-CoA synthetase (AMP-forming)/AMP-acid ligase II